MTIDGGLSKQSPFFSGFLKRALFGYGNRCAFLLTRLLLFL